jgi:mitochondrial fission protein ELM1
MQAKGFTRPFEGRFEHWTYVPPDDTARTARLLRQKFGWG